MQFCYRFTFNNALIINDDESSDHLANILGSDYKSKKIIGPIHIKIINDQEWHHAFFLDHIDGQFPEISHVIGCCSQSMHYLDSVNRKYLSQYKISNENLCIAINAIAGGGKTTALIQLAETNKNKKILYLAFNKAIVDQIRKKHITNLYPVTFDSLIFNTYRNENPDFQFHDLRPQTLGKLYPWMNKLPIGVCKGIIKQFEKFCAQSETDSIETYFKGKKNKALETLWVDTLTGQLCTFCGLRKLAHCEKILKHVLTHSYDAVFVDEAQDFDPIMLDILLRDCPKPKIFVGDKYQQIYEWRGSINAFEQLPNTTTQIQFYSTFRIGEPACSIISKLTGVSMVSAKKGHTIILDKMPNTDYVYLFRTWRSLLQTAQKIDDIFITDFEHKMNQICDLHTKLHAGIKVQSTDFDDDLPAFLLTLSPENLDNLQRDITSRFKPTNEAKIHMYTIHSFKGMEAHTIRISSDINPNRDSQLYYVACTRCVDAIYLDHNASLKTSFTIIETNKQKKQADKKNKTDKVVLGTDHITKALSLFRKNMSAQKNVPPYVIFTNRTLLNIVNKHPTNISELHEISGIGKKTVEQYGDQILLAIN